jgi:excisionase family DNA binding protein
VTTETTIWLCVTDYACVYNVDRSTVYKWLDAGLLETYRVGRVVRIKNKPPSATSSLSTDVGRC